MKARYLNNSFLVRFSMDICLDRAVSIFIIGGSLMIGMAHEITLDKK